ncbi:MAG TPA: transcription-repair coupling factor, partial [Candidatus Faecimonas intestinavium]|nr:transcription-repair coupling factor [Candidatus Faecimonas intestinavium]
ILVVVNSLYEANQLYSSLSNYTDNVSLFPMDDFLTSEALAISPELRYNRLETINKVLEQPNIVITNLMGYLRFLPTKKNYQQAFLNLEVGNTINPQELVEKLVQSGYTRDTIVNKTGEFAVRGFIIDVFPVESDTAVRIEFFDDEIESIRYFDCDTQKSLSSISSILIRPCSEFLTTKIVEEDSSKQKFLPFYEEVSSILDYLGDSITFFKDYEQLKVSFSQIMEEVLTYRSTKDAEFNGKYMFDFLDIHPTFPIYYMNIDHYLSNNILDLGVHTINNFNENADSINQFIRQSINDGKTVVLCLKKYQIFSVMKFLNMKVVETDFDHIIPDEVNLVSTPLKAGFVYQNYVFLTANELFLVKEKQKKYRTKFKYSSSISDINKLSVGDYVVHNIHGIGVYNGIKTLSLSGVQKDYVEVLYQGEDKLYIPVEKIDLLNKYTGKEGYAPKVNKLGGSEWEKTKNRVKKKVQDMADDLLQLYAEREARQGFAFSPDCDMLLDFEAEFPYELTPDQKRAIAQIKEDMEKPTPMDRLLCGDVGFGKTEVAFVAAFKAILDSKQVLFLCPTTILSNQHYENAMERFKDFPVSIGLLNRFTSPKEVKRIIEGISNGTIDLVFGTHRLLSDDIKPKNLGLLVIDEEQRFGVTHKEKIKRYKTNVDVLTLTATPIPRTLQMSLVGIRSLSLIETPPVNRYPVQTYVIEENNQILKDAIYKELSRDGQVFILYNKVESIEEEMYRIQNLVPDARIITAHGQMNKNALENRILDFINHEYDILVCTTIIETGIDIPNVNTLIIMDADRFGLSQLYQIRGRVGRSDKFAYAYLMYHPAKVLTESAVKRLNVIKEFTALGSGFSIATRDLSIRGAGDILGSEQAGFIDSVGIDLYLRLLNEEVARKKNIELPLEEEEIDSKPLLNVSTHIDDHYVSEDDLKIEIHRKINEIDSAEKLEDVKAELEDRFGRVNDDMLIYMYEEWFEKLAKRVGVKRVSQTKNSIELVFPEEVVSKFRVDELFMDSYEISPSFRFLSRGSNLVIILDIIKLEKHPIYYLVSLLDLIYGKFLS